MKRRPLCRTFSLRETPAVLALLAGLTFTNLGTLSTQAAENTASENTKTGTLTGKIYNAATGDVLTRAKVSVEGTNIETFTDNFGEYRLDLPAGSVSLRISYTGMKDKVLATEVLAEQTMLEDIKIAAESASTRKNAKGDEEVVVMDAFSVREARETNAYNIAANEQRFSVNIKNVVSSDAFGDVTEGNVGEFIKYLPGITVDYVAADVRTINVRGFSSAFTNISINGMRLTSSVSGSNNRGIELEQISINNVARAEVNKVPTPDSPADSLGGNVNLISKNAFERKGFGMSYKAYVSLNSEDLFFDKTPGPKDKNAFKMLPGTDFDITLPFSKNFGLVITGLSSNQFNEQHRTLPTWNSAQAGATPTNPYLQSYTFQDGPKVTSRNSINVRGDWRIKPGHTLSFGYQDNFYDNFFGNRNYNYGVGTNAASSTTGGSALSWGSDYAQSAAGRGTLTQGSSYRAKRGQTQAFDLYYHFKGKVWDIDAGLHGAYSKSWYRDLADGYWNGVNTSLQGISTVRFAGIQYPRPQTIEVRDSSSNLINVNNLANYRLTTLRTAPLDGFATLKGALANAKREFDFKLPFALKTGVAVREEVRDNRRFQADYTFVGADGKANTADDVASTYASDRYSNIYPHYGLSNAFWASPWKLAEEFKKNPGYFTPVGVSASTTASTPTAGQAAGVPAYIYQVQNSMRITETTSAAYLQAETKLFQNKLGIVTGVRFEKVQDDGYGYKYDPDAIYQRNADGTFTKDSSGARVRKAEAGAAGAANSVGTMLTMTEARMMYVERGYHAKTSYDDFYPSLHLNYNVTNQLTARFAYAKTFGRPDFADIVPNTSIDENELYDASNASAIPGTITTSNTGLKPWKADNYDLSLEYYYAQGGMVSAGVFRKELSDFWGNVSGTLTSALASELGIDPRYVGWNVSSKTNVGDAAINGCEFNLVQPMKFLGSYGKYFNLTANATWLRLFGPKEADFKRFISQSGNIGLTYSKRPFTIMVKLNHRGQQRWDAQTGSAYGASPTGGTFYEYDGERNTVDVNFEYQLRANLTFFANARNILNVAQDRYRYNSLTPDYARNYNSEEYGVQWAIGMKGKF